MSKIINAMKSKLIWYLLSCIVVAGVAAVGSAYGISQIGSYYVENTFDDQELNRRFQLKYMEDLQNYVTVNKITRNNIDNLSLWAMDNQYVYFSVYNNNTVIFNSDYVYSSDEPADVNTADKESENSTAFSDDQEPRSDNGVNELVDSNDSVPLLENSSLMSTEYFYPLTLADDSVVSVDMFCYDYWNYNYYVLVIAGLAGVVVFVLIFTHGIQKKLRYINQLEQELRILEGGNLEYPVTVKGIDELGKLANGIDQMRLSIIENQKQEEKLLEANKNLVTSMSHDLRTPLTTLTGYLEILNMDSMSDENKRKHYLELSLAKTLEIKELSDELFEYFLVYEEDNRQIDVEPVSASLLIEDLIENQFLSLEEEGFVISGTNNLIDNDINCLINPKYMRRVLNNILSNLMKYAEKDKPIEVMADREDKYVMIKVRNVISSNLDRHESTKIGLITCERIMKLHHGSFQYFDSEGEFVVKLLIPLAEDSN